MMLFLASDRGIASCRFIVYRNLVIASIRTNRTLLLHVGNIETDDNRSPRSADDLLRLEAGKRLQKIWYEHVILF